MWTVVFFVSVVLMNKFHTVVSQDDQVEIVKRINEELPPGSYVSSLPNDNPSVQYTILQENRYFRINNGMITTRGVIDRDDLMRMHNSQSTCRKEPECYIEFEVQASSSTGSSESYPVYVIKVYIEDVNDHAPEFDSSVREYSFAENSPEGTNVLLQKATDKDSPRFGVKRYRLETADEDRFIFDVIPKEAGAAPPLLVLKRPLDREKKSVYKAVLIAEDGGDVPKTARLDLVIKVSDINDHAPKWQNKVFEVTVKENITQETAIFTFKAVDMDSGENGRIVYSIDNSDPATLRYFRVEPSTGILRNSRRLGDGENRSFNILVVASDCGRHPRRITATLHVKVTDVNDEAPKITVVNKSGRLSVRENLSPGQQVAMMIVEDYDSGDNGKINCTLNNAHFLLKPLSKTLVKKVRYRIITNSVFDREVKSFYNLRIVCRDFGVPRKLRTQTERIYIEDENDNPPLFHGSYNIKFKEGQPPYTVITRLNATDLDSGGENGRNGRLKFWLPDDVQRRKIASINSDTGEISSLTKFDREVKDHYTFVAYVKDLGDPSRTASTTVYLHITDINDHAPEWMDFHFMDVPENVQAGTVVGTVQATDLDIDDNGRIVYRIIPPSRQFAIDRESGMITTKTSDLDREKKSFYELNVTATDKGHPPRHSVTPVRINIIDRNDNDPVFVHPRAHERVNLSCYEHVNHLVTRLQANDSDAGDNGAVEYEISHDQNNPLAKYFEVDPTSGDVLLVRKLDCSTVGPFGRVKRLMVRARDRGTPSRYRLHPLSIIINNKTPSPTQEEEKPGFDDPNFNAIVGLIIATVVLVCILLITIFVLRRKTFVYTKGNRMTAAAQSGHVANAASEHSGNKNVDFFPSKAAENDPNLMEPYPPPYYYTCETECYDLGKTLDTTQRKRPGLRVSISREKEELMLNELNHSGTGSGTPSSHSKQRSNHSYQAIHFPPELPNAYVDCHDIRGAEMGDPVAEHQHNYSELSETPSDADAAETGAGGDHHGRRSSVDALRGTLPARPRATNLPELNRARLAATSTPMLDKFAASDANINTKRRQGDPSNNKSPYCTVSFV